MFAIGVSLNEWKIDVKEDRQTDRQIDIQTDRQTDRQKDRQIDRQNNPTYDSSDHSLTSPFAPHDAMQGDFVSSEVVA